MNCNFRRLRLSSFFITTSQYNKTALLVVFDIVIDIALKSLGGLVEAVKVYKPFGLILTEFFKKKQQAENRRNAKVFL